MARRYDVEGTRSFLYWAIGLALLTAWAVRDGWFPPQSKIDAKTVQELANFVLFNKVLAVGSAIGSVVCAIFHLRVK